MTPDDPLPAWLPDDFEAATRECHPIALVPADPDHGLDVERMEMEFRWQNVEPLVHEDAREELVTV